MWLEYFDEVCKNRVEGVKKVVVVKIRVKLRIKGIEYFRVYIVMEC